MLVLFSYHTCKSAIFLLFNSHWWLAATVLGSIVLEGKSYYRHEYVAIVKIQEKHDSSLN